MKRIIFNSLATFASGFAFAASVYAPGAEHTGEGVAALLVALIVGGAIGHMLYELGTHQ